MWNYLKEVRAEMRHVSWPTRRMTIIYTAVVIGISLGVAVYLGVWDYLFTTLIQKII